MKMTKAFCYITILLISFKISAFLTITNNTNKSLCIRTKNQSSEQLQKQLRTNKNFSFKCNDNQITFYIYKKNYTQKHVYIVKGSSLKDFSQIQRCQINENEKDFIFTDESDDTEITRISKNDFIIEEVNNYLSSTKMLSLASITVLLVYYISETIEDIILCA